MQLSYKNESFEKTSEDKQKGRGTHISFFLAKDIFFILVEKISSNTHYPRQTGMTFLSMLIHTISLHLLLRRAVFTLLDQE